MPAADPDSSLSPVKWRHQHPRCHRHRGPAPAWGVCQTQSVRGAIGSKGPPGSLGAAGPPSPGWGFLWAQARARPASGWPQGRGLAGMMNPDHSFCLQEWQPPTLGALGPQRALHVDPCLTIPVRSCHPGLAPPKGRSRLPDPAPPFKQGSHATGPRPQPPRMARRFPSGPGSRLAMADSEAAAFPLQHTCGLRITGVPVPAGLSGQQRLLSAQLL